MPWRRGLAVAEGGYALAPDAATLPLARETVFAFRIVGSGRRPGHRIRGGARAPDAPDRRAARPDRLPAPAPRARRHGRWSVRAAPARGGRLPRLRRLRARRPAGAPWPPTSSPAARSRPALPAPATDDDRPTAYRAELSSRDSRPAGRPCSPTPSSRGGRPAGRRRALPGRRRPPGRAARGRPRASRTCTPRTSDDPGTIRFGADLPSAGRYRLFLQFRHEVRVRTVAHTWRSRR